MNTLLTAILALALAGCSSGPDEGTDAGDTQDSGQPDSGTSVDAGAPKIAADPEVMSTHLPSPLAGISAACTGDAVYVFGGDDGQGGSQNILKFDGSSVTVTDSKLPTGRFITDAVYDSKAKKIYVIGGFDGSVVLDEIVSFDPTSGDVSVAGRLPAGRARVGSFFDGDSVYMLGGNIGGKVPTGLLDEIVQLGSGTVTKLSTPLPMSVASRIGVVADGSAGYLFGGLITGGKSRKIIRYSAADGVKTMDAQLPFGLDGGGYGFYRGHIYVVAGEPAGAAPIDNIYEYVPATDTFADTGFTIPEARKGVGAAVMGDAMYIFGGVGANGSSDEIVKIRFE